jgi:molecular chaperone Hsp33
MTSSDARRDFILPFQIEGAGVRGRVARLDSVVDDIVRRHDYPAPVSRLLSESITLTALLGNTLKFDGVFSLQTRGNGPVRLLAADFTTDGTVRGYAGIDPDRAGELGNGAPGPEADVNGLLGDGNLAFTVDQGVHSERYQGIVGLEGGTLAECAESYFRTSEQLPTRIKLGVSLGTKGNGHAPLPWRASGIMIQQIAGSGGDVSRTPTHLSEESHEEPGENWRRASILFDSLSFDELTDPNLTPEEILYRLYHEDGVRVFDPHEIKFGCRCSRERIAAVIKTFSDEEIAEITVNGKIEATCEFCSTTYVLDPKEAKAN